MSFEKLSHGSHNPESTERKQYLELAEHENNLKQALSKVSSANLFDPNHIKETTIVVFDKNTAIAASKDGKFFEADKDKLHARDFVQGKRTDFIGIPTKHEVENIDRTEINDRHFITQPFLPENLAYEEAVIHEIAHHDFDVRYKETFGEYKEPSPETTDVSDEYRQQIKERIKKLVSEQYPNLDLDKFTFSRQQIAEIHAMMYQREFSKRTNTNTKLHSGVKQRMSAFLENPDEALAKLNQQYERNCSMDDFYQENHTLSLVVTPLLEKEYPDFDKRKDFLFAK